MNTPEVSKPLSRRTWMKQTGFGFSGLMLQNMFGGIIRDTENQVDIMDELLIDPLPDDVKPFIHKRGYWFPDEAASVYGRAFSVLSFECHSPIIALRNNTPAFYLRQPEDTIKGQMYYDLGIGDWVFSEKEHRH